MKIKILILAAATAGSALILTSCSRSAESLNIDPLPKAELQTDRIIFPANAPQLSYLKVETVEPRKSVATGMPGRLAWNDEVTARVFSPVSGRLIEINASPGEEVTPDSVLAKVKSPDFGEAQAEARKASADLLVAERAQERIRELVSKGAAAKKDAEMAEADYTRALSERERASAKLVLYGGTEDDVVDGVFSLRSLIKGTVVERATNPGQEVRSDQVEDKPLFVVTDPSKLWLFFDLSEVDAVLMRPGQEVRLFARAFPEKVFKGRVEIIGHGLDAETRTIKARCLVDNSENLLRAEMYVNAEVVTDSNAELDVPTTAIYLKDKTRYLFVESAPGQFDRREVKAGVESHGRSLIREGLEPGERFVVDGALLLEATLEGGNS
jgi:cobalt-zinc-cadmium efflux system membrane fusion protein